MPWLILKVVLKYLRHLNKKNDLLSGLINVASINQSLGNNEEAIKGAEEALTLAQEMKNISTSRRGVMESYMKATRQLETLRNPLSTSTSTLP